MIMEDLTIIQVYYKVNAFCLTKVLENMSNS